MKKWEQRWHPLREEWVIIAAHRQDRPWTGMVEPDTEGKLPGYLPDCYFCPGNKRVSGKQNPDYAGIYVFDNDHPCVGEDAPEELSVPTGAYKNSAASGVARVLCYHPRHDMTLAEMDEKDIVTLLESWQEQYKELGSRPEVNHVLIFENKGEAVGVSNPHPHCQIYATNFVFKTIENEARACLDHYNATGRYLLADMIEAEIKDGVRIIAHNENAIGFIPYCARYAYETFVAPKRPCASVADLTDAELVDFAAVLSEVLIRFDNLWKMSFPYVMVLHQAPTDGKDHKGFHFHIEFHPPLRKPDLLKFLAGPEVGGGSFLSDTWPEDKASELRAVPKIHYSRTAAGEGLE